MSAYNPNWIHSLRSTGITNHESEDLGAIAGNFKRVSYAICRNERCLRYRQHQTDLNPSTKQCGRCKYMLLWKTRMIKSEKK